MDINDILNRVKTARDEVLAGADSYQRGFTAMENLHIEPYGSLAGSSPIFINGEKPAQTSSGKPTQTNGDKANAKAQERQFFLDVHKNTLLLEKESKPDGIPPYFLGAADGLGYLLVVQSFTPTYELDKTKIIGRRGLKITGSSGLIDPKFELETFRVPFRDKVLMKINENLEELERTEGYAARSLEFLKHSFYIGELARIAKSRPEIYVPSIVASGSFGVGKLSE